MDTTAPNNLRTSQPTTSQNDNLEQPSNPQNDHLVQPENPQNDNLIQHQNPQNDNLVQPENDTETQQNDETHQNPNPQNDIETQQNPNPQTDIETQQTNQNDETQNDDAMDIDEEQTPSRNGLVESPEDTDTAAAPIVNNGTNGHASTVTSNGTKKKKKNNCAWIMRSSRKSRKRAKFNGNAELDEDRVLITPVTRTVPEKKDDTFDITICLSKTFKAEKVELSEDRLTAGSCKGYRMVRATRGVVEGAWYFEIKVVHLGDTGHTRLGWSNEKGDLQAPVGYDENSFGYRDVDGSKVHKAVREVYGGEGYKEGDVIGCYVSLPEGGLYAPKPQKMVLYKGQRYFRGANNVDQKEDVAKIVPGSVISFFKNGICQGVAFKDISGGRYYPAASMYTLPNQSNCVVSFNFGPEFDFFPEDFGEYPTPRPMIEVPYQGYDVVVENGVSDENKQQ